MEKTDLEKIVVSAMSHAREDMTNEALLKNRLMWFWQGLQKYTAVQVSNGINRAFQRPGKGHLMPSTGDIIEQIDQMRAAKRWEKPPGVPQLPEASADRMRSPEVDVRQRIMTLNEYLALSDAELQVLGQSRQSVNKFKEWLE